MEVPEIYMGGYFGGAGGAGQYSPEKQKTTEHFTVDDLLDFSNEDAVMADGFLDNVTANSTDSSTVTAVDSCNSGSRPHFSACIGSRSFADSQFSGDLCVPYDDLAELEWLSNFVDDSFSAQQDFQALQYLNGPTTTTTATATVSKTQASESSSSSETLLPSRNAPFFKPETPLPGKARSKRSRAAPCDWSTRLVHVAAATTTTPEDQKQQLPTAMKTTTSKKKESVVMDSTSSSSSSSGRKCLHCGSEKTPQWRTGPMGPKTLCNACGVRFKSGRLVPEYRPSASPTFVSAKHSNSHRKVLELRRQKEMQRAQHQQFLNQASIFGVANGGGGGGGDDYLIHHHHHHQRSGPDFRHLL
ncbi:GATA transcription factor 9 [Quercus suber]|uniref:GATA transcription factor n=1 Tax=Quercus suber TaxID=58331 RepID=A0AAW0M7H5_QUESU|nr:GATA transcription factor 9-like [Quercus suber]POE53113.1 gata transcription factor 9 [Quercus suber]